AGSGPLSSSVGTTTGASPTPFAAAANAIPTAIGTSAASAVATTVSATAAPWTHGTKSRRADGAPRARGRSIGSTFSTTSSSARPPAAVPGPLSGSKRASGSAAGL
ncbi:unnamed protein product, partial [Tilletia controversa]